MLTDGAILWQYSIINKTRYEYSGRAKTSLKLLSLSRDDLIAASEEWEEVQISVEKASLFIKDFNGVPVCDYVNGGTENDSDSYSSSNEDRNDEERRLKVIEKFRKAVHKVVVLNRRDNKKQFKFFDLLDFLKKQKRSRPSKMSVD